MLTPEYLQSVPDAMVDLYAQAEMDILADMARRINGFDMFIPSAQYQMQVLEEMGALRSDIVAQLSRLTGKSRKELAAIMREAGVRSLAADETLYKAAGLTPSPLAASIPVKDVLTAGLKKTNGLFTNLTKTTANTATKQFERVLDRAYMQISSGAIAPATAIKGAIKRLAKQGVGAIEYPSGHIDSIEVAVRRAVVTGVNQTCGKLQEMRADELGCDLVEVTAHAGARPSHALWQGRIFSRSGKSKKYPGLVEVTRYGHGDGLMGWNCNHNMRPYIEGMPRTYSRELLDSYETRNYEYNGRKMSEYEALQQQRYIERNIRRWKQENAAMKAAGLDTGESAAKLRQWQGVQKDFLSQTGLKRQGERERVYSAGRAVKGNRTTTLEKLRFADGALEKDRLSIGMEVERIPQKAREIAERQITRVVVTDGDRSGFRPSTGELILNRSREPGTVAHEYAHAIETALKLYEDPKFIKILTKGFENIQPSDIIFDDTNFSKPIVRIWSDKFISLYQGRLYEQYGIFDGKKVHLDGMREYFSEGFRFYVNDPATLRHRDKDLFDYIERILK